MNIMKAVADSFKSSTKSSDHFGILTPLLATSEYVTQAKDLLNLLSNPTYTDVLTGKAKAPNKYVEKAVDAYHVYVKALTPVEQAEERHQPLITMKRGVDVISSNVSSVEDNFRNLFGNVKGDAVEANLRSSALLIIGYLEKSENYTTWFSNFAEHLTADTGDMVPPFRTKELITKAATTAQFTDFNLTRSVGGENALMTEVKTMQRQGSDVSIKAPTGEWIDEFMHDDQLSNNQQTLIGASLRSIGMMGFTQGAVRFKDRMDLLNSRKDWLTSKIVFEQNKLRGLDPESVEYKKISKSVDHYAALVSRYEQKLERMRA